MNKKISMDSVIKCKTDKLGRISIPAQYRRALGIKPEEEVSMVFNGKGMFVFKETKEEILNRECNNIMNEALKSEDISMKEYTMLQVIFKKLVKENAE